MKNKLASVCALLSVCNFAAAENSALNFGLEMGVQTYFIAPNIQYRINEQFSVKGSAGLFFEEGASNLYSNVAAYYYPFSNGFRASVQYGTHVAYEFDDAYDRTTVSSFDEDDSFRSAGSTLTYPAYSGISLGVGWDWANNSDSGWQLDALYILTSEADDLEDSSTETVDGLTTTILTETYTTSGPDGSGSVWVNLGYQF